MMIRFTCPKCRSSHEVAPPATGNMVACPSCGQTLAVKVPAQPAAPAPKPAAPKTAPVAPRPAAAPPQPASRPRVEDVPITASIVDRPKKKKKHRDDYQEEGGNRNLLIIGGVAGGVVLVGGLIALIIFLASGDSKPAGQIAANNPAEQPRPMAPGGIGAPAMAPRDNMPPGVGKPYNPNDPNDERRRQFAQQGVGGKPPTAAPAEPPPENQPAPPATKPETPAPEPTFVGGGSGASASDVYQYVLKSTAWIVNLREEQIASGFAGISRVATGSGSLIDRTHRLVLTNFHVVQGSTTLKVFFPAYKDNALVTSRDTYMDKVRNNASDGITGKVVALSENKDLALIQLERLPSGVEALPLAKQAVGPGQNVHSVGSPGSSPALWVYTPGVVRQLERGMQWRAGPNGELHCHADVVITNSSTNPGDSGGPLVNDRGELVGVTHGYHAQANAMSLFIEAGEAKRFVENHLREKGVKWVADARAPLRAARRFGGSLTDLIKNLSDKEALNKQRAAQALGELGPDARLAIPSLMKLLKDSDDLTRRLALEALQQIGPPDKGDMNMLTGALKDENAAVRAYAASSLGKLGADAQSAVNSLLEALKDSDANVRVSAIRAMGGVGASAKAAAAKALTAALEDGNQEIRIAAAEALTNVLTPEASDVPVLLGLVKHKDSEARVRGIRTLAKLGKDAKEAIPDLTEACKGGDRAVRREAILALAVMMPEAKVALPALTEALKDHDKDMRISAAQAMGLIGVEAKAAVPGLTEMVKDKEKDIRLAGIRALGKLGREARPGVPALAEALEDSEEEIRDAAIDAVGNLGATADKAIPNLISLLDKKFFLGDDQSKAFRDRVAKTLAKIGKPAVNPLIRCLTENNPYANWGACKALGEMGPIARDALRTLQLVSDQHPDRTIREEADRAMRKIRAGK